jgi:DNA-binding response OmpR family regulator
MKRKNLSAKSPTKRSKINYNCERRAKLQDRPFDIPQILLERPGEAVSREEFRKSLCPPTHSLTSITG